MRRVSGARFWGVIVGDVEVEGEGEGEVGV